jgi:HD-GYP domain-containing protein (c-di-GMP phosphodiesterase class II)
VPPADRERCHHPGITLGELLAVLSLAIDLGHGQPMEHVLRQWVIALELARRAGLEPAEVEILSFITLIGYVGCHADAHEQVRWFGDDIRFRDDAVYAADLSPRREPPFIVSRVGAGKPPLQRARALGAFLRHGRIEVEQMRATHCRLAADFSRRLGLRESVREALLQLFERWDGHGDPGTAAGDLICLPVRIVRLADIVEVRHRTEGQDGAVAVCRERSGTQFDPGLVDLFCDHADDVLAPLADGPEWAPMIAAQPGLSRTLADAEATAALEAIADYVDLKAPHTLGHSRTVADLAAAAAPDVAGLRIPALLHDIGGLGVSNAIWEKTGELTLTDRERIRMRPYLTERMLGASPALAPLATLAASAHERLDGSGYPRGLRGDAVSLAARALAAADVYCALREPRPYRAALDATAAADTLRDEARAGRLDGRVVEAVLDAAGHRSSRRPAQPGGLTARELDVLRLIARGMQTKQIAADLHITPKTVGHHIHHIYAKTGVSNRVGASLYATERGLL